MPSLPLLASALVSAVKKRSVLSPSSSLLSSMLFFAMLGFNLLASQHCW
jgi:hypothetical protein